MAYLQGGRYRVYDAANDIGGPISERLVRDLDEVIHYLEPDQTPYYSFLTAITAKETKNVKFEWLEKEHLTRQSNITVGDTWAAVGAHAELTLTVAAADIPLFQLYNLIFLPVTGNVGEVIAVNTVTNEITLYGDAAYAATAIATSAANAESVIELSGTAFPEGSGRGHMVSSQATNPWNYAEIFKTEVTLTGNAIASAYYGGDEWQIEVEEATILHKKDIEFGLITGQRLKRQDGISGKPIYTTRGQLNWIATNAITHATLNAWKFRSGAINFIDDMKTVFRYGSPRKLFFTGQDIIAHIQKQEFLEDVPHVSLTEPRTTKIGFEVQDLRCAFGTASFIWHKRFTGYMSRWIMAVDPQFIRRRPVRSRDTRLRMLPWTGEDTVDAQIMTNVGLQCMQEKTHSLVKFTALS